jgi:hypothetical protein
MVKIIRGERVGKQGRLAVGCSATVLDPTTQKILLIRRADSGRWAGVVKIGLIEAIYGHGVGTFFVPWSAQDNLANARSLL